MSSQESGEREKGSLEEVTGASCALGFGNPRVLIGLLQEKGRKTARRECKAGKMDGIMINVQVYRFLYFVSFQFIRFISHSHFLSVLFKPRSAIAPVWIMTKRNEVVWFRYS